jgi:hypothetical protein
VRPATARFFRHPASLRREGRLGAAQAAREGETRVGLDEVEELGPHALARIEPARDRHCDVGGDVVGGVLGRTKGTF